MAFKSIVFLASALLVQTISCVPSHGYGLGGSGYGLGTGSLGSYRAGAASNGGGFPIQSASPINVDGLSVLSENQIEGCLDLGGQLPFIGAVGLGGQLPTCGSAGVNYCCGNGHIGINQASGYGGSYGGLHY